MKIVIVNCFDTYEDRVDLLYEYFISRNHNVSVVQSDFRHFEKVKRSDSKPGFTFVESLPYYKNLSSTRLKSHYKFAKKAFEFIEELNPDLLYVLLPPNSLAKFADRYKRNHKNVKLYFDVIDLWPETMPIGKVKSLPPFTFWRQLRDKNLKRADFVITECNLYQTILRKSLKDINTDTLYLARQKTNYDSNLVFQKHSIHLCYLGSINNIIDITVIAKIVNTINNMKPVVIHIIGDGENKDMFISEIKKTGATVEYYGNVYDSKKKQQIFDKCHFGLNIMKESVCVGLTMKSIDYFEGGLPILNNIRDDTTRLVEKYHAGINIRNQDFQRISEYICRMTEKELLLLKSASRMVFEEEFTNDVFNKKLDECFNNM